MRLGSGLGSPAAPAMVRHLAQHYHYLLIFPEQLAQGRPRCAEGEATCSVVVALGDATFAAGISPTVGMIVGGITVGIEK
jgi:hypothetical protein